MRTLKLLACAALAVPGSLCRGGAAADGRELWSAPVEGRVIDLAFHGGRLFAVTDAGAVVCFAPQ